MSIKANELRIGNYILNLYGRYGKVDWLTLKLIEEGEDYHPIPLTESILEKAGYETIDGGQLPPYIIALGFFLFWNEDYSELHSNIGKISDNTVTIKYLHDFQNWYYANSNKQELDINL